MKTRIKLLLVFSILILWISFIGEGTISTPNVKMQGTDSLSKEIWNSNEEHLDSGRLSIISYPFDKRNAFINGSSFHKPGQTFEIKQWVENTGSLNVGELSFSLDFNDNKITSQLFVEKVFFNDINITGDYLGSTLSALDGKNIQLLNNAETFKSQTKELLIIKGHFQNLSVSQNEFQNTKVKMKITFTGKQKY